MKESFEGTHEVIQWFHLSFWKTAVLSKLGEVGGGYVISYLISMKDDPLTITIEVPLIEQPVKLPRLWTFALLINSYRIFFFLLSQSSAFHKH